MNEDFLHYVWKFQKYTTLHLVTVQNESLQILEIGRHNFDAGPDFFFGKVVIGGQIWVGTIEIHVQSSHWYAHRHERDSNYDNVILHVVWQHDMEVKRSDETTIPTLELKGRIHGTVLKKYRDLFSGQPRWINCERQLSLVQDLVIHHWLSRLYVERLEAKSEFILRQLRLCKNDWEAVLFRLLCKNFGLKVNADSFQSIGSSVDYKVVRKTRYDQTKLEALLLGQAGLLTEENKDDYHQELKAVYAFHCIKFRITNAGVIPPKFFRLRPPNFPTIRLAQLAAVLHQNPNLFSLILDAKTVVDYEAIFKVVASKYWDKHYNFGVVSGTHAKKLSKSFIELLVLNTILPLKHCHAVFQGNDESEAVIELAQSIRPEKNGVVSKFYELRDFGRSAMESQALLQLKNKYCDKKECMRCAIGNTILKTP